MFAGTAMKSLICYIELLYDKVFDVENKCEVFNWEISHWDLKCKLDLKTNKRSIEMPKFPKNLKKLSWTMVL